MRPTVELGGLELDAYTALVALGIAAGLAAAFLYLYGRSRRTMDTASFLHLVLFVFAWAWVGARAYHILTHWEYYQARPDEIGALGTGGLAFRGALIMGGVGLVLVRALRRGPARPSAARILDAAALGLALGQAIGWAGALVQGANYGVVSDDPFALELPDAYGLMQVRFPLQHAEILLFSLLCAVLLVMAWRRLPTGSMFWVYGLVASLGNALLEFKRGDQAAMVGSLRVDQIVDLAWVLLALAGLLSLWWRTNRRASPGPARSLRGM